MSAIKIAQPLIEQGLVGPIDELIPYNDHEPNPRQGDIGQLIVSLEKNGQYRPVVVNKRKRAKTNMHVLAGNHTWRAMKQEGCQEIARTFVDVDDATARRIMLVDNRTNDLASNDEAAQAELLKLIREAEGPDGLLGTGFDGEDLDDLLAKFNDDGGSTDPGLGAVEYRIIVSCESETHQAELLQRFEDEGLTVQAISQ